MAKNKKQPKSVSLPAVLLAAGLLAALLYVIAVLRGPELAAPAFSPAEDDAAPASPAEPSPAPTAEAHADLRLSELMPKNHTAFCAPDGSFPDWVELYNADSEPVDVRGWRLSDKEGGGWALPARTLQPGEYLLVYADGTGRAEDGLLCADFSLSPGETVYLYSPGGTLVDQLEAATETANHSLARDENGEVFESKDATPGLPNTRAAAEAYAASLSPSGALCINEAVVSNLSTLPQNGKTYDWVELKNISDEPLQLSDYYLSDDEDEPLLWRLPEQTLAPGRTFVVFCSGDESLSAAGKPHASFALNAEEEDLFLSDGDGRAVDYVYLRGVPLDGSMGRQSGRGGWARFLRATPNAENGAALPYIDKTRLAAGEPLPVVNGAGFTLRCFVGGEELDAAAPLPDGSYESWITLRAYQGDTLAAEDRAYYSRLPVLYIDTSGGAPIRSKTAYRSASLVIQGNAEAAACEYAGAVSIRGRGNTSWDWPKKPYKLKLGRKTDLYGMGESKHYLLLPNYLDESLLRNTTGFQISRELGLTAMESVWTDVVLNGEYIGNYQLCEQIRIGESRVDIFDWEEEAERIAEEVCRQELANGRALDEKAMARALKSDLSWATRGFFLYRGRSYTISDYTELQGDLTGGYLFELSKEYDEKSEFETASKLKVMLKSPEELRTNTAMMRYVKDYWQSFDAAIRSENGYAQTAEGEKHYTELADLDSMVSYWLALEIIGNNDADWKSRFAYKDTGSLLQFGPVWDFDWGCGSMKTPSAGPGWTLANNGKVMCFFKEFLDDPVFVARATEKYWEVRPYLETLIEEGGVLDTECGYLYESGLADAARWDRSVTWPSQARGFEQDTLVFRQYLRARVAWLDEQFASDAVLLQSTSTPLSASPYTRDEGALRIELPDAAADTVSAHAPAKGLLAAEADAAVAVTVSAPGTEQLEVYVNGLLWQRVPVQGGQARFSVPAALLAEPGRKTVVSLIGKTAGGETTARNFTTVIAGMG